MTKAAQQIADQSTVSANRSKLECQVQVDSHVAVHYSFDKSFECRVSPTIDITAKNPFTQKRLASGEFVQKVENGSYGKRVVRR